MSIRESALLIELERRVKELESKIAWLERTIEQSRPSAPKEPKRINGTR